MKEKKAAGVNTLQGPYLVLWKDNQRIGSVVITPGKFQLAYLHARFVMTRLQIDSTGTEHWNVTQEKSSCKKDC